MSDTLSPDELPKRKIAKKVIAAKRRYFLPDHSISVEADSVDEAIAALAKLNETEKEGDA